ncbi:MAG TPA: FdrA family protein [Streptosporangiaceae bacterium]|nr:FdrA family protein [Streptosporangiaceae bacterium]
MGAEHVQARIGAYADSVTLMQVSARAQAIAGVRGVLVAMATELNLGLLDGLGLRAPAGISPHDLLVAIKADDAAALHAALAVIDEALAHGPGVASGQPGGPGGPEAAPLTTRSAVARAGRGIALISVPGQYALAEAMDALEAGCDVMVFSDNVPVEHEVALKEVAARQGRLVMGPDCGTAIVAGLGLGFANAVRPGPIGLVAASGTGAQQVSCLLDVAGAGCGAVLGVGGRDLSAVVGGRSARTALALLDEDPGTELIMLLSKPPDPQVAAGLRRFADMLATPVQFALIGPGQPDLTTATETALAAIGVPVPAWPAWPAWPTWPVRSAFPTPASQARHALAGGLRGLFAGGTLCDEAMVIATGLLGEIYSNRPFAPELRLDALDPLLPVDHRPLTARHAMIDFGADELTSGRPHPMIDQRLRLDRLDAEAADPATAVIMLDVVLGYGAHPDPAAELAPAIQAAVAARDSLAVVVALIGTAGDPQGLTAQVTTLAEAGADVFASNAQAARFACGLITGTEPARAHGAAK